MYSKRHGFTLIEILVVISILAILLAIVTTSFSSVRVDARDKIRVAEVEQAILALRLYAAQYDTFHVANSGHLDGGAGWLTYQGSGGYNQSVSGQLVEGGFLGKPIQDPLIPTDETWGPGGYAGYQIWYVNDNPLVGACVMARLENPTESQLATLDNLALSAGTLAFARDTYNLNYGLCVQQ